MAKDFPLFKAGLEAELPDNGLENGEDEPKPLVAVKSDKDELGSPSRSLLHRLRQELPSLSPTEREIGEYVLEKPRQVLRLPMDQLAREIGVSQGTLSNFSQALGYTGFKAFRLDLAAEVNSPIKLDHSEILRGDNLQDIANKAISADIDALLTTLKSLDMQEVERAIEALKQARKVDLYGLGSSSVVAQDTFNKLKGLGLIVNWLPDISQQVGSAVLLDSRDVTIAFSSSGETPTTVRAQSLAHQHGATTIMITGNPHGNLARFSDIRLVATPREPTPFSRNLRISARIAMMGIIDIIYLGLMNAMGDIAFERVEKVYSLFSGLDTGKK
ncbi:MAG TPA: MurR/RpiR family transcriptional regulator [Chloroflexia bacterium]|nr:MurR/RpiR family transcriptional regulator [Chloroflexia bacterium]